MPLDAWLLLLPVSLAIVALTIAEGVVLSQSEGRKHGEEIDPNDEVFAYGLSNVAAAVFAGMPMGASASRTAAMTEPGTRWLVIDLEAVSDIDPTAAAALTDGMAAAAHRGVVMAFSRVRGPIADPLARYGLAEVVGPDRIFATNRAAAAAYERQR